MVLSATPTQLQCGRPDLAEAKATRMISMMKIIIRLGRFRRGRWSGFRHRVVRVISQNRQILWICLEVWYILICRRLKSLEMITRARNPNRNNRLKKLIKYRLWRECAIVTSLTPPQSIDKDNDPFRCINLLIGLWWNESIWNMTFFMKAYTLWNPFLFF